MGIHKFPQVEYVTRGYKAYWLWKKVVFLDKPVDTFQKNNQSNQ